ncbi:hypothetical protein U879_11680 [Defluviimonas sp. 20V17]|uniref:Uncharacterized protein n=1 Tax=Allgaiera indica TaxID=765699 RepID=A0AAN4UN96_9RHOB|nr:hypothetical protein [Allgaiera indica]KDB03471.1 hypothetical protein U879_11680 [Defluviimonas sp. 20V17]GHD98152.1 hypothetical protein GCM10008024_00520 [Allgaiera indica]SDW52817.1 hypothetical protein SAMN05444006_104166 [Allgaiera indica]
MADKTRRKSGGKDAGRGQQQGRRPVRPFLAGTSVAAGWGALHMPAALWSLVLGGFALKLIAIAIAAGGLIAAAMEVVVFAIARIPWILSILSRRA